MCMCAYVRAYVCARVCVCVCVCVCTVGYEPLLGNGGGVREREREGGEC